MAKGARNNISHGTFNTWLAQLPLEIRWKIALELYTTEYVSTGRAAEIAGLGYIGQSVAAVVPMAEYDAFQA